MELIWLYKTGKVLGASFFNTIQTFSFPLGNGVKGKKGRKILWFINMCHLTFELTPIIMDVCPKYPAVPLSIKGTWTIKHIKLTYLLTLKLSQSIHHQIKLFEKKAIGNFVVSVILAEMGYKIDLEGVHFEGSLTGHFSFRLSNMSTTGTRIDSSNCSIPIVSKSTKWIMLKTRRRTAFLRFTADSPAPTINTFALSMGLWGVVVG